MEIHRNQLVEMFFERGEIGLAEKAERNLPERVDPLAHEETLRELGIDPTLLVTQPNTLDG